MDYAPFLIYSKPQQMWPHIENALRRAASRGVQVKLMIQRTSFNIENIRQLNGLKNVEFYFMEMPFLDEQGGWDHTRLTHSKFVVADETNLLITTSNMTGDYFENTAGVSVVLMNHPELGKKVADVARRDIACKFTKRVT